MARPLLSVIVPVYKAEKYIDRCINSILNQTLKSLELILVDDGSPDNSGAICDEYAKKDARVKVIHKENGGAASARNVGIKEANGEYMGFCDADDYLALDMYQTLISLMNENNLNTVSCLSNTRDEEGNLLGKGISDKSLDYFTAEEYIKKIYLRVADVSLCTRVIKSQVVKQLEIPENRRVEDFYFTIALMQIVGGTAVYNYPFYEYTVNNNSVTHSADCSIYLDGLYFFEKSKQLVDNSQFKAQQKYYELKMLYLLFISAEKNERKMYKQQFLCHKTELRKNIIDILKNKNLVLKEKILLLISSISINLPNQLYKIMRRK